MAEAFVRAIKRDDVRVSPRPDPRPDPRTDPRTAIARRPAWFEHANTVHPHRALGYRSRREVIADQTAT